MRKAAAQTDFSDDDRRIFEEFKAALRRGEIRSAEKNAKGIWKANKWVKRGILLGFRMGKIVEISMSVKRFGSSTRKHFHRGPTLEDGIRIVPGGTIIRDGAYVASNTVLMPPVTRMSVPMSVKER